MKDTNKNGSLYNPLNRINEHLTELNLQRLACAAAITIFFLGANLTFSRLNEIAHARLGIWLGVALSFGFLLLSFWSKRAGTIGKSAKKYIYIGFWITLILSATPFWLAAGESFISAVNLAIFVSCSLMAFPIFSREEIIGVFSFFALYVAITTLVGKTPPGRVALLLLIILVSYIITFYLHKGYIDIILCLQVENDTDSLTGLCNRRAGMDIMYRILAICNRAHMFCVVYMIDIDFFKSFNDTFGHLSGDSALKSIASCIQRQFSRPGDVVCRFGGEEFAVMAIMSGERAATQQAEQLLEKIRDMQIPSAQKSLSEFLTISVGCVCFWPEGLAEITSEDSLTAVLTKADAELYKAKQGGRNRISLRLLGPSEKTP